VRNQSYERGSKLKVKIQISFVETIQEPLFLDRWSLAEQNIMDMPKSFIWIINLFDEPLTYDSGEKFWGYVGTNAEPFCV
jgi:hypothetical protein